MQMLTYLQNEYIKRKESNSSYSLRAFARDLGISHTYLSLVLSGKRRFSASQTAQIGLLLGLTSRQLEAWIEEKATNTRLKKKVARGRKSPVQYQDLQIEYSKVIAGWYYLPILECTYLKDACADPKWFASKLGISIIEARDAIQRLLALEMLEEVDGKLKKTQDFIRMPSNRSMASLRAYHQSVFERAKLCMQDVTDEAFARRQISSGTVAVKKQDVERARKRLRELHDEFIAEFGASDSDDVYQLSLQFFPLTQTKQKNGESK